jgi:hypothetical protein
MFGRLTPPKDVIVYTPCGEFAPEKVTIEWFASSPPRHTQRDHKADDDCAEAMDTTSEPFKMSWYWEHISSGLK